MAVTDALWVGGQNLDVTEARLNFGGLLWADTTNPQNVRTGVFYTGVTAGLIRGNASMTVLVDRFHFVGMKSQTEGPYLGANFTIESAFPVPAPPALGSKRIDVLYVMQKDSAAAASPDAVTAGALGVLQGVAGSNPQKPTALPVGAVEVGTIAFDCTSVVPTRTTDAQVTLATTCQWTALKNQPLPVRTKAERDALTANFVGRRVLRLDRGGLVQTYDGSQWRGTRRHGDTKTLTTDASGYITVTHGCGFTPGSVIVTPVSPISGSVTASIFGFALADSFNATTFRLRALFANGTQISSASVAFSYECVEAQD